MTNKEKVLQKLKQQKTKTGGHCGLHKVDFDMDLNELRPIIMQLKKEGIITAHDNIHGTIYKLKNE